MTIKATLVKEFQFHARFHTLLSLLDWFEQRRFFDSYRFVYLKDFILACDLLSSVAYSDVIIERFRRIGLVPHAIDLLKILELSLICFNW